MWKSCEIKWFLSIKQDRWIWSISTWKSLEALGFCWAVTPTHTWTQIRYFGICFRSDLLTCWRGWVNRNLEKSNSSKASNLSAHFSCNISTNGLFSDSTHNTHIFPSCDCKRCGKSMYLLRSVRWKTFLMWFFETFRFCYIFCSACNIDTDFTYLHQHYTH